MLIKKAIFSVNHGKIAFGIDKDIKGGPSIQRTPLSPTIYIYIFFFLFAAGAKNSKDKLYNQTWWKIVHMHHQAQAPILICMIQRRTLWIRFVLILNSYTYTNFIGFPWVCNLHSELAVSYLWDNLMSPPCTGNSELTVSYKHNLSSSCEFTVSWLSVLKMRPPLDNSVELSVNMVLA